MSGRFGVKPGKQSVYTGKFSHDADNNTGNNLADCDFKNFTGTKDSIRKGCDDWDLGSYPAFGRANYYVSDEPFKAGKQIYDVGNIDPDGSRALQKDWHARAGFSGVVSPTENEQGGTHPDNSKQSSWPSRGSDKSTSGQGSRAVKNSKFDWA
jgi:hypothetical protein